MKTHRVNITSTEVDTTWSAEFESLNDAQAWLSKQIGKPHRLPQRVVLQSECSQEQLDSAVNLLPEVVVDGEVITPARATLPAQYNSEIIDISAQETLKANVQSRIAAGKAAIRLSEDILALISGWNLQRELTAEQITSLQSTFSQIELLLRAGRPFSAKPLIDNIEPDGTLVTQEMLDQVEFLYEQSGLME